MKILYCYCLCLLLFSGICLGQDRAQFTRDKEFYLKGNATVIGNSILGKSSKAFDKLDKLNDETKMRYIDIDNDADTWSSSSAYFSIPEASSIVYASLHWSATYNGERSGLRVRSGEEISEEFYKKLEERQHNPQKVKLKINDGTYHNVIGTLIYDGEKARNRTVKSRAPYAYMAEVTELVKGIHQGNITVANIPATQGKMNGGSSAGWLLYIVYEDEMQPYQYMSTYYGLEFIKKEVVEIDFGSFKSSENGELTTNISLGALEGDSNLDKDQIRIYNPKSELFLPFGNKVRPANNFFNSSITAGDDLVLTRNPASKNTLGFDIAQLDLDEELNRIIANSPQGVQLQFSTSGDHYFLFFVAFKTTISEAFYEDKTILVQEISKETPVIEVVTTLEVKEEILEAPEEVVSPSLNESPPALIKDITTLEKDSLVIESLEEIVNKPSVKVPDLARGYHIISNVFSNKENAAKWEKVLASKELYYKTFLRPDNKLYYVSLGSNQDGFIIYEILKNIRKEKELERSWILKVNM